MKRALALLFVAGRAWADVPADVTADQAVELYRQRSPRLVATKAQIDVTGADLVDAGIYPNPDITLSTTNIVQGQDTFGHSQELVEVDVPILIGKRGHRRDAARARIATKTAEVAAGQAGAEIEIRRKFVALLAAQHRVTAFAEALDEAKAVRVIVAGRQAAGAKSPYDLERTDLAVATAASKLDGAKVDVDAASGALAVAVGISDWHPHALGDFKPAAAAPGAVAGEHPELLLPRAGLSQARKEEAQAHADAIPTPSLQVQAFGTTDPQGIAMLFGVTMPLPIFDRNQGAVARARASARQAELEGQAKTVELSMALANASRVLVARRETLARWQADAVERLPRVRQMAEASYKNGQGGIVELLDALDAISEAKLHDIELIEAVLGAELDVRAAALGR
jgi:outer membrane protein, heavy metal efflux system